MVFHLELDVLAFLQIEHLLHPQVLGGDSGVVRVHLDVQLDLHRSGIGRERLRGAVDGHVQGVVRNLFTGVVVLVGGQVVVDRRSGRDGGHGHRHRVSGVRLGGLSLLAGEDQRQGQHGEQGSEDSFHGVRG